MNNLLIEQDFISWCNQIHPNINPYIFIQRHNRYFEEYLPIIDENMTKLHQSIHDKKPNINFSFKGRIKSKRSFLIKTFRTIAKNINTIFSDISLLEDDKKAKAIETKDSTIDKYFKFLLQEDKQKYEEINNLIKSLDEKSLNLIEKFRIVFSKLDKKQQDKLITRLGRTEDAFAYRPIIHSVDFSIKDCKHTENDTFEITDENGQIIPIYAGITFNPEQDVIIEDNGLKYINYNGTKIKLNERNLLYPIGTPSSERKFENAQKNPDGTLTLLQDSIILNDGSEFDIKSIKYDSTNDSIFCYNQYGECKNLSLLLLKNKSARLRKYDESTIQKAAYDIFDIIQDFYKKNEITSIQSRFKDYIQNPKPDTGYMSIHDSSFDETYGYTMETQIRSLLNEDESKNEDNPTGHDMYKKAKSESFKSNPILASILEKDDLAFDSSTSTLMKILENPHVELTDVLGKYIIVTTMKNGNSVSYQPSIDTVFHHTFEHSKLSKSNDVNNRLDFSNYKSFMQSRAKLLKEPKFFDEMY